MNDAERLLRTLSRPDLPPGYDRWRVEVGPHSERPTDSAEWAGALVLVESGTLEVECVAGGHETFVEGNLLVLGWLPLRALRNAGDETVRLLAVRRRGEPPQQEFLHVFATHTVLDQIDPEREDHA